MLLLSLLIVPALFSLSTAQGFQCPIDDIERTLCKGPKDCFYPHPTRCDQFIFCEVNSDGRTGRPTVNDCPPGLEWNNNDKICDFFENSTCPKGDGAAKILPRGEGAENKIRAPFECPREDFMSGKCDKQNGCMYPDPKDCRNYFHCAWNADGQTTTVTYKSCPRSGDGYLQWNNKDKKCDLLEKSTCHKDNGVDTTVNGVLDGASKILPRGDGVKIRDEAFVCPRGDFISGKCQKQNGCMYPEPKNCRNYIHCDWNADGERAIVTQKSCPKSANGYLEWNDKEKRCDSRENSTCPKKGSVVPPVGDVLKGAGGILPRGDGVENKIRDAAPFKCPISDIVITQCRGAKDCVYPNPGSCNTFIQCSASAGFLAGTPAIKNCLPGHEWNDKDKKCDVPEKSTCLVHANGENRQGGAPKGKKSVHARAAFTCPTEDIIKTKCKGPRDCRYPDPESCSHFYLCFVSSDGKTGTPHNYACGEGLLWNDKLKSCDWPASSTCKL
ncbi:hypothetical protein VE00_07086 [Pseudogymnoascus sp. WSF 3629]|nr:hypothetical protein VE00_07086 [Pseudogymnoascus sp. WSF 3629]